MQREMYHEELAPATRPAGPRPGRARVSVWSIAKKNSLSLSLFGSVQASAWMRPTTLMGQRASRTTLSNAISFQHPEQCLAKYLGTLWPSHVDTHS